MRPPSPVPLYARLVRLDRPPGARFTALYADPARARHVMTLARECAEGEGVDGCYRVTFASASAAAVTADSRRVQPRPNRANVGSPR